MQTSRDVPAPIGVAPRAAAAVPWRLRHRALARSLLYGAALALVAAGGLIWKHQHDLGTQEGYVTKLYAVDLGLGRLDPEGTLKKVREDVLSQRLSPEVRLQALLTEASLLDVLLRYGEAEAAYAQIEREWPSGQPRGALLVPWANMRVSAGKPKDALELLDRPGATEGFREDEVARVRLRAQQALAAPPPAAGTAPAR